MVWNSEDGWDPDGDFGSDLENGLDFGVNLMTPEGLVSTGFPADGHCGDQNDLLVPIVSTEKGNFEYVEPKEVAVGDKDKVYRTVDSKGEYSYHQIKNDGWEHFGGNIIPVNNLKDLEVIKGTPVTNGSPISKLYINKSLSNDEIKKLFANLEYENGYYCIYEDDSLALVVENSSLMTSGELGEVEHSYYLVLYTPDGSTCLWSHDNGWDDSAQHSIDVSGIDTYVGPLNKMVALLVSSKEFKPDIDKKAIYRVKEDNPPKVVKSAVPAGGSGETFSKLYLNQNLSEEEMLALFTSLSYTNVGYDYRQHYPIHGIVTYSPSEGTNDIYTLDIICHNDGTSYAMFLMDWSTRNRLLLYSIGCSEDDLNYHYGVTFTGWNPDIANYINDDGSFKQEYVGSEAYLYTDHQKYYALVGDQNDKLIDLIYNQTIEETYDYAYYQYTSNGWERYGVGVIPVKELPSAELPPKYITVPNEGEICKITWNKSITQEQLLTLLDGLPEEFWVDKDGYESNYYIFNLKVIWNGDPTVYFANANIYLRRESNSDGSYTYYLGGQDGSSFFTIFRISEYEGWIWDYSSYIDLLNNIFDNQANNNGQWYFMSEDLDGNGYKYGHYNHLLTDFVYANNPDYDPNYKPAISQTVLYRVDTNEGSKYYNFNGTNWTEVGTGAGGLSPEDMNAILQEAKNYTDEMKQSLLGEGISETFDTLKEIQNWIETDGVEATELATELAKKQNKLTAGNGISISEDGTISLNIPLAETEKY